MLQKSYVFLDKTRFDISQIIIEQFIILTTIQRHDVLGSHFFLPRGQSELPMILRLY